MKMFNIKREIVIWLIVLSPILFMISVYEKLPDVLPSHYNIQDEPDAYTSKRNILLLHGGMNLFLYVILLLAPYIDPKKDNYVLFMDTYYKLRIVIHVFIAYVAITMLSNSLGYIKNVTNALFFGLGIMFAIMGYYLSKVRFNYMVGIRLPWTLSSEKVWGKTHQKAGRVWIVLGILLSTTSVLFSTNSTMPFITLGLIVLLPFVISLNEYYKVNRNEK